MAGKKKPLISIAKGGLLILAGAVAGAGGYHYLGEHAAKKQYKATEVTPLSTENNSAVFEGVNGKYYFSTDVGKIARDLNNPELTVTTKGATNPISEDQYKALLKTAQKTK